MVLVADVDEAARIDHDVLGLRHQPSRLRPAPLDRIGRQEVAGLARQPRIGDVVDAQTGIEIGEEYQVVVAQQRTLELVLMLVVRAEAPAAHAEVLERRVRRGRRQGKERYQARPGFVLDVDQTGKAQRLVAVLGNRLGIDHDEPALGERLCGVHRDEALKRRRERKIGYQARTLHVRDVEDHESARAVGKVSPLPCDIGAAVQHGAERHPALAPGNPLALAPPARDLDWVRRIGDVDDLVDVPGEAGGQRGRMHVAPPGVVVAVRAVAAGTVVAELPRVLGIREIPDQKAFVIADAGIRRRQPFVGIFSAP